MRTTYLVNIPGSNIPAIADLSPPHPRPIDLHPSMPWCTHWHVNRINVPRRERRKRVGTSLLRWILQDADREHVALCLHPVPSGDMDFATLWHWYEDHGFTGADTDSSCGMIRLPHIVKPESLESYVETDL